jgi:nitrite reductase/ring-hydroxylating ferredoxin subunit/alkylhydroperoxidase/carboxymuconolactone decarboxylase family protein YurZ
MAKWVKVAETDAVPPGAARAFAIEHGSIAVFNVDGKLYAIDDSCPHQGSSLSMGRIEGYIVTCRTHGLKVNVTGGKELPRVGLDALRSFPVESRTDGIYVDIQEPAATEDAGPGSHSGKTPAAEVPADSSGPWDPAFDTLREWDPDWAKASSKMATNPWTNGILPRKFIELVCIGLSAACTNLDMDGTRRHIRAALEEGASREELLFVLKCASVLSLHSCSLGAPILLEEAKAANVQRKPRAKTEPTPAIDAAKRIGQWNAAWDPFVELDPRWTDEFMTMGTALYAGDTMTLNEVELLSVALDASCTHMYAPGTRRHIKNALSAGATPEEIMEVLKLCVSQGVQACNLALPILAEELELHSTSRKAA